MLDRDQPFPDSDEEVVLSLPAYPSTQALYRVYRQRGDFIECTLFKALQARFRQNEIGQMRDE